MVRLSPDVRHTFKYHDAPSVSKSDVPFVEYWRMYILNYDASFQKNDVPYHASKFPYFVY